MVSIYLRKLGFAKATAFSYHLLLGGTFLVLINCGGGNSTSSSASSTDSAISSSLSNQQMTVIQEGDPQLCPFAGAVEQEHAGFSGSGYVNVVNSAGSSIRWAVDVPNAGLYQIAIGYANGNASDRPASLAVGSQSVVMAFPSTEIWSHWQTENTSLTLLEGPQTLVLTAEAGVGLANIDTITLTGPGLIGAAMCPQQSPLTIWLAGDSTVANGQTPCPVGWGKTLGEFFNDQVSVQNLAAGGRSVRTWLYDVTEVMGSDGECIVKNTASGDPIVQTRWQALRDQIKAGDYLFIQFGINDGDRTCPRHVGENAFKEEYRLMAKFALERGAHPILFTPAPAIKCSGSTAVDSRGFISAVFEVGKQLGIPVIDLHKLGTALYNQLAFCPVAGGDVAATTGGAVGEFFCNDHTHFDTQGARKMGELITDAVQAQYLPLADYLK